MRVLLATGLAVSVLVVAGCDDGRRSPTAADLDQIDLSPDHRLVVDDDGFHPRRLAVQADDVIQVANDGTGAHTVTATDEGRGVAFDARLEPGEELILVAPGPGTIDYRDLEMPDHGGRLEIAPRR